jgi:hypothetical protein
MFDPHYSSAFDSLSEMEQLLFNFEHVKQMLYYTREKSENPDVSLDAAIAFLEYSIERVDRQFPEVWNSVITQHPQRFISVDD